MNDVAKPNFFIIGAPKCGTTSLAHWLSQHPDVAVSAPKEPHFFSSDLQIPFRCSNYGRAFEHANGESAVGEASTEYIYSSHAIPRIVDFQPECRIICCLRDPTELVWAWHHQLVCADLQPMRAFESAWRAADADRRAAAMARGFDQRLLDYRNVGALGRHVSRILENVDRKRIMFVCMDDIRYRSRETVKSVLQFLKVPDVACDLDLRAKQTRVAQRSKSASAAIRNLRHAKSKMGIERGFGALNMLSRWNRRGKRDPISAKTADEIRMHFIDDVKQLESLVQRDLSHWRGEAVS